MGILETVSSAIGSWITAMFGWIADAIEGIVPIFYTTGAEGGLTFIGVMALFGLALGILFFVINFVRGFLR